MIKSTENIQNFTFWAVLPVHCHKDWKVNCKIFILTGSLQKDFQAVEEELDKLQNICEEEVLEHEKKSQMSQLVAYKKKKEADAFSVKGKHVCFVLFFRWEDITERYFFVFVFSTLVIDSGDALSLRERMDVLVQVSLWNH